MVMMGFLAKVEMALRSDLNNNVRGNEVKLYPGELVKRVPRSSTAPLSSDQRRDLFFVSSYAMYIMSGQVGTAPLVVLEHKQLAVRHAAPAS